MNLPSFSVALSFGIALPVMMVTAYGDNERRRRASELGAFEFPTKSVDFDQLKAQLRQLLTAAD